MKLAMKEQGRSYYDRYVWLRLRDVVPRDGVDVACEAKANPTTTKEKENKKESAITSKPNCLLRALKNKTDNAIISPLNNQLMQNNFIVYSLNNIHNYSTTLSLLFCHTQRNTTRGSEICI
jgi:ketopantoate reductase